VKNSLSKSATYNMQIKAKNCPSKPIKRTILILNKLMKSIHNIHKLLSLESMLKMNENSSRKVRLVFHYDSTAFTLGDFHFSILTMKDPTKRRKFNTSGLEDEDAILPIALMIHDGHSDGDHKALFQFIDQLIFDGKDYDLETKTDLFLKSDIDLLWPCSKPTKSAKESSRKRDVHFYMLNGGLEVDQCGDEIVDERFPEGSAR